MEVLPRSASASWTEATFHSRMQIQERRACSQLHYQSNLGVKIYRTVGFWHVCLRRISWLLAIEISFEKTWESFVTRWQVAHITTSENRLTFAAAANVRKASDKLKLLGVQHWPPAKWVPEIPRGCLLYAGVSSVRHWDVHSFIHIPLCHFMYSTGRWFNDKGFERTVPWSSVLNKQEPSSWYYTHNFPEEEDDRWLKTVAVSEECFWAPSVEILVNFQVQAVACWDLLDFIYYFEMYIYVYIL